MKTCNNQKGFAAIEAVLIVVVLGIIGFTGWFVYHSKQAADKSLTAAGNSTPQVAQNKPVTPKTDTVTSISTKSGVVLKYPQSWQAKETADSTDGYLADSVEFVAPKGMVTLKVYIDPSGLGGACNNVGTIAAADKQKINETYTLVSGYGTGTPDGFSAGYAIYDNSKPADLQISVGNQVCTTFHYDIFNLQGHKLWFVIQPASKVTSAADFTNLINSTDYKALPALLVNLLQ